MSVSTITVAAAYKIARALMDTFDTFDKWEAMRAVLETMTAEQASAVAHRLAGELEMSPGWVEDLSARGCGGKGSLVAVIEEVFNAEVRTSCECSLEGLWTAAGDEELDAGRAASKPSPSLQDDWLVVEETLLRALTELTDEHSLPLTTAHRLLLATGHLSSIKSQQFPSVETGELFEDIRAQLTRRAPDGTVPNVLTFSEQQAQAMFERIRALHQAVSKLNRAAMP